MTTSLALDKRPIASSPSREYAELFATASAADQRAGETHEPRSTTVPSDVGVDVAASILRHMTAEEAIGASRTSKTFLGGLRLLPPFQRALAKKAERPWPNELIETLGHGNYLMQAPRLDGPAAPHGMNIFFAARYSERSASIVGLDGELRMLHGHRDGINFGCRTAEHCLTGALAEAILWNVADGNELARWGDTRVRHFPNALSAGCLADASAVLGEQGGTVTLWNIETGASQRLHEYPSDFMPEYPHWTCTKGLSPWQRATAFT